MKTHAAAQLLMVSLGAVGLLGGCDRTATTPVAGTAAPPATVAPPVPVFSINEMMVMIVDRPGEMLWDVEKKGAAPKTDDDWYELEHHAVEVASAATIIELGGTGPNDAAWASQPTWRAHAQQLVTTALAARQAAKAKDLPALVKANGQIVDACEACHKEFKSDIPTGGLFIHKRPVSTAAK